jgi:hypothetical protein
MILALQVNTSTLSMMVQDRDWKRVTCVLSREWHEVDLSMFEVGWTLFVRYAEARRRGGKWATLWDIPHVIDARLVTTLPAPLSDLLRFDELMAAGDQMTPAEAAELECANCEARSIAKLCAGCKVTHYCNGECQLAHLQRHKSECDIWAALRDIHAAVGEELKGKVPFSMTKLQLCTLSVGCLIHNECIRFKRNASIKMNALGCSEYPILECS